MLNMNNEEALGIPFPNSYDALLPELVTERLMASKVDKRTGKFDGANCHGEEKVRRFLELYPDAHIDEFYSDLYCDTPLAKLADKAFIVKGERLLPWDEKKLK